MECDRHPPRQAARDLRARWGGRPSGVGVPSTAGASGAAARLSDTSDAAITMSPFDDPELLPFKIDLVGQRVLWVRLTAEQRAAAAFLDERALPPSAQGAWAPLASLYTHDALKAPVDGIFHIGHCGSTLLARLLEAWPSVQVLREPLPLRVLADAWALRARPEARLDDTQMRSLLHALQVAWSRPLAGSHRTVVKATSSCNGLVEPLLGSGRMRVVLLGLPLATYLAALMKSPDSVHDAASAAGERLASLQSAGWAEGDALHRLSLPEQCAMGWLAERVRFDALAQGTQRAHVLRMDFDALLADPGAALAAVATHLGLPPAGLEAALASPAWTRYSKAQAHAYAASDRAHDLALSRQRFGAEIEQGLRWVDAQLRRGDGPAIDRDRWV